MTPQQAADRIGVSRSLVYALIAEGRLRCIRVGRRGRRGKIVIEPSDVDELIAALREECRAGADED